MAVLYGRYDNIIVDIISRFYVRTVVVKSSNAVGGELLK